MKTVSIHRYTNKWCVNLYDGPGLFAFVEVDDLEQVATLVNTWLTDGRRELTQQLVLDLQH